jgi:uncharacterized protein YgiM (DUF1202 family)
MKIKNLAVVSLTVAVAVAILPAKVFAQYTFPRERSQCDAILTAVDSNSHINLRSGPGTNYRSLGYGLVGDRVYLLTNIPPELDSHQDAQGYFWYRVGFPNSGAKGWIREDLMKRQCRQIDDYFR